jgi:hypothetical protein
MGYGDTTLGGSTRSFPTTQWSQIVGAQDRTLPGYRDRLDALLRTYWRPAYAYIRVGWKKSNEDAKDLTQAFFARMLQNGLIASARAEVRRPIEPVVALEGEVEIPAGATPDEIFDRQWLSSLIDDSIALLEAELRTEGKEAYFNAFRSYLLDPDSAKETIVSSRGAELQLPTYASVAGRWGLSESDVRNYLTHCRARLRELLKAAVRSTVENPRDVEEELRSLLNE